MLLGWEEMSRLLATAGIVGSFTWTAAWWINNKINAVMATFLTKLEYHERHDDERFNLIQKDLWQIRTNLAAYTGKSNNGH